MSARTARASAATILFLLLGAALCAFAAPPPAHVVGQTPADFLAEGIAVTPKGAILVSGVQARTILRLTLHGAEPWLKGLATGGLFGMAVDARRDRLWVAETGGD